MAAVLGCAILLSAVPDGGRARAQEVEGAAPAAMPTAAIPVLPTLTLQAIPPYGPAPLLVGFMVVATDPADAGFVSFKWDFGDGHISIEPPVLAYNTYDKPGTYVVTVTGTTADGRTATAMTGVIVKPKPSG